MAITYFQDTIFFTDTSLSAPGDGTVLQVASNNFFATKSYTLLVTLANKNTNVVVRLDGSIDGTNYAPIIADQTIGSNGSTSYSVSDRPVKFIKPVFVSEAGGTDATVLFSLAAIQMSVLPRTQLGYTLGIRRDKNIYGKGERPQKNPFEESRGRTRMAGEKRIDLFTTEQDFMATPYIRGTNLPKRFLTSLPVSREEKADG